MTSPIYAGEIPNWPAFYRKLCHVGPVALTGISRDLIPGLQLYARTSEAFWSECLQDVLLACWNNPSEAVDQVMQVFVDNVLQEFLEPPLC